MMARFFLNCTDTSNFISSLICTECAITLALGPVGPCFRLITLTLPRISVSNCTDLFHLYTSSSGDSSSGLVRWLQSLEAGISGTYGEDGQRG